MAAAVSLRSLTLLFSAGWGGSYLYNNSDTARDFITAQLAKALRSAASRRESNNADGAAQDSSALNELSEKVSALSRDMTRAADRPVVVLGPPSSKVSALADALSLAGWAVLAVGCGSACYYVAIWKGWSLRDLAWVSQASFDTTVSSLQGGIARVSGAVATVRREFGERMRLIESRVEAVRSALSAQIESEVSEVKAGIADVQADVGSVHATLTEVTDRIDAIDGKLDTATHGIMALVRVVSSLAPDAGRPGNPFWELKQLADSGMNGNKALLDSPSLRRRSSHSWSTILDKSKPNGKPSQDANLSLPITQTGTHYG